MQGLLTDPNTFRETEYNPDIAEKVAEIELALAAAGRPEGRPPAALAAEAILAAPSQPSTNTFSLRAATGLSESLRPALEHKACDLVRAALEGLSDRQN